MAAKNIIAETTRDLISILPQRKAQASNWMIKLLSINKPFIGTLFGNKIEVHPMESASRSAYFLGFYERETTIWCIDFLKKHKPKMIFDVGANFGYFSYLSKAYSPDTRVISFEPDPYNHAWLKRNLTLIGDKNLSAEQLAVSNKKGSVSFLPSNPEGHMNLWSQIKLDDTVTGNEITVPSVSLDEYCAEHQIEHVDLIKMDIEGAEGFAVEGMAKGLEKGRYGAVLIELHPYILKKGTHSLESIAYQFTKHGYKAFYFNSAFNNQAVTDTASEYYNLNWDDKYLLKTLPPSEQLSEWEHVLFVK